MAEETVNVSSEAFFFDQQQKSRKIREKILAERLLGSSRKFSIAHLFRLHTIPSEGRSMPEVCGLAPGPCLPDQPEPRHRVRPCSEQGGAESHQTHAMSRREAIFVPICQQTAQAVTGGFSS